jgi:energy-coupling factor transporter ATP-binding protein EcfA2
VLRGQLNTLGAGRGSVVFVTGPTGAGKTTLLAEAASLAADRGIRVFCGGGDPWRGQCRSGRSWTLLSPPTSRPWLHELSQSPDQRFWLLRELQESLAKTAHRAPLLIIIDDLQRADAATTSAPVTLSRWLATHRIGWMLALRRGELPDAARTRSAGWRRVRPRSGLALWTRPRSRRSPGTCSAASRMRRCGKC